MTKEEALERYQGIKLPLRILLSLSFGLSYPVLEALEDIPSLTEDVELSERKLSSEETKYRRELKTISDLPLLENSLSEIRRNLEITRNKLPDEFKIDEILAMISHNANLSGVDIQVFSPEENEQAFQQLRYVSQRVQISLQGQYVAIADFLDRVLHLKLLMHAVDLSLSPAEAEGNNDQNGNSLKLKGIVKFNIFRTMKDSETAAINNGIVEERKG
ncbi:MAG: type 4a pilus biogenesis protein PilO [Oligoflexales bacterium]